ncbi:MAG TPA: hypothetical protein VLA36_05600 [Longimicrobiales bacterium]|nr:hypothetical protein [Longimicrobiales bacterium]
MRRRVDGITVARDADGVSVLEAVVALLLGFLLIALILSVLSRQRETVAVLGERAEALATGRTVRTLLRREARAMGMDAWGFSSDSLSIRAFRGMGTVCPHAAGGLVVPVTSRGVRGPDPSKDSVMVVTAEGAVLYRGLMRVQGGAGVCVVAGGAGSWDVWTVSDTVPPGVILVRYFERGSYHLSVSALRYRRGRAGRQPLTPETLRTPESRFTHGGVGLHAHLLPKRRSTAVPVDVFIGRGGP